MSATTFLVACMRKTPAELRSADLKKAAAQHQIPVPWAEFWAREELNHPSKVGR